ncbi:MAG TPA: cysteine--tRNA ligase [Candidatus Acidoferrum sp.]|nr:cysteine--tRNA ligase [Candidatus Acidoferrum sp.]
MTLRLLNTYGRKVQKFVALKRNAVRMYTCGPTVWDYAHIGNFRTYVFQDVLRRYLKFKRYKVIQVTNITDVDDKTIRQSKEAGVTLREYTKTYEEAYHADLAALNIERAEHYPRATEHIAQMIALVKRLARKGFAYQADGSVYFDISKFKAYGRLSGAHIDELKTGARVDSDEYSKDEARDFVLWKGWRPEDGDIFWETAIGKGRPGWHIECSAMSMKYLGTAFDIHSGGEDLIFPHHENEIAQSQAATGKRFVRFWLHSGMLLVAGRKMAKSSGNFFTLRDLLSKGHDPLAVRYLLMSAHYRAQLNFTEEALADAEKALEALRGTYHRVKNIDTADKQNNIQLRKLLLREEREFEKAMDDDLNTPRALAAVHRAARAVNRAMDQGKVSMKDASLVHLFFSRLDNVLGILGERKETQVLPEEAQRLIRERDQARANKDWATADRIRNELLAMSVVIEDTPTGTVWKRNRR